MPFVYIDTEGGWMSCPQCRGKGALYVGASTTAFTSCWACDGSGQVFFRPLRPLVWQEEPTPPLRQGK